MKKASRRSSLKFAVTVAALTFPLGGVFDTSTIFLNEVAWYIGAVVVVFIVVVGVVFDMIGLASAAARETPFHAMASKRVYGAKRAIFIVRNAEKFATICSDVVGDIAGVLSGAGALAVAEQVVATIGAHGWIHELIVISFTAFVTSITVFAKAIGKTVAIQNPTPIVLFAARVMESIRLFGRATRSRVGK